MLDRVKYQVWPVHAGPVRASKGLINNNVIAIIIIIFIIATGTCVFCNSLLSLLGPFTMIMIVTSFGIVIG